MPDEKPLVDLVIGDRFWLAYAQELVKAAASAPDRRAEQLTGSIAWFWTIYSAAALVVFTTKTPSFAVSVPLVLPVFLLILAYWMASRVRIPILAEFDPRVPSEIETAHHNRIIAKNRMLAGAEFVTGLAAACIAFAVALSLFATASPKPDFYGSLAGQNPGKLLVGGAFPKDVVVRIDVQPFVKSGAAQQTSSRLLRASSAGELKGELDLTPADSYRVTASWNEDKAEKTNTIRVKRDE